MTGIAHEVNVITVMVDTAHGVLLSRTGSGQWGFVGSEDLVPGEAWEDTQRRGLERDLGPMELENLRILHLESYAAGTVGPRSKFGVFILARLDATSIKTSPDTLRWCRVADDLEGLDLIQPRVRDLVVRALETVRGP